MKNDPKVKITVDLEEIVQLKDLPEGLVIEGPCAVYIVADRYVTRTVHIGQELDAVIAVKK